MSAFSEWLIKRRIKNLRTTIEKDIQKNEVAARVKINRAITPLLKLYDVQREVKENGKTKLVTMTDADLRALTTEELVEVIDKLLEQLEEDVDGKGDEN